MRVLWVVTKSPWPVRDGGRVVMKATLDALTAAGVELTIVAPSGIPRPGRDPAVTAAAPPAVRNISVVRDHADTPVLPHAPVLRDIPVRQITVEGRPLAWPNAAWRSLRSGRPVSIERHASAAVAACVADLVQRERFDVVHVEQPQALAGAQPARAAGLACVLRAQNVESAVWAAAAARRHGPTAALFRLEARRFRRFEAAALAAADATIALSPTDATILSTINPSARVVVIPPPMSLAASSPETARVSSVPGAAAPPSAPAAPGAAAAPGASTVPGGLSVPVGFPVSAGGSASEIPFVWIGSHGWPPNDEARAWLLAEVWPAVSARLAQARLHMFGPRQVFSPLLRFGARLRFGLPLRFGPLRWFVPLRRFGTASGRAVVRRDTTIVWHPAPEHSGDAFIDGAILLLPLRTATGVRMRLLEAWSRGVPAIASPAAVDGLDTEDGRDVLLASDPRAFADAAARLATDRDLRTRLVQGGRATLARRHDPAAIAQATLAVYRDAIERRGHATRSRT